MESSNLTVNDARVFWELQQNCSKKNNPVRDKPPIANIQDSSFASVTNDNPRKSTPKLSANQIQQALNSFGHPDTKPIRNSPSEQEMMIYIFNDMDKDRDDILVKDDVVNYFEKNDLSSDDVVMFWKCFDRRQLGHITKETYYQLLGIAPKDNEAVAVWRRLFHTSRNQMAKKGMTVHQIKRIFAQTAKDRPIDIVELWLQSRRDDTGLREVSIQEISEILKDWCGINEEDDE